MAMLDFCVEPTEAVVVVDGAAEVVWDGAAGVVLVRMLELEVELVVLLQEVYMLLFVAASSLTPVSIV
jgi:cyanophycinase-like exopeptidase